MATQNELLGEVLTILCQSAAYWTQCTTLPTGVNATDLLDQLTTDFPESGWDQDLLDSTLEFGVRRGALTTCTSVDPITYYARRDMVRVNPQNEQFRDVCSGIYTQRTIPNQYSNI